MLSLIQGGLYSSVPKQTVWSRFQVSFYYILLMMMFFV